MWLLEEAACGEPEGMEIGGMSEAWRFAEGRE
jgi:hypothetical protein